MGGGGEDWGRRGGKDPGLAYHNLTPRPKPDRLCLREICEGTGRQLRSRRWVIPRLSLCQYTGYRLLVGQAADTAEWPSGSSLFSQGRSTYMAEGSSFRIAVN